MRIDTQPAYILHSREFRDSSLIIECLSRDHGRVSGVLKGVRASSKSAKQRRSLAQPLVPLLLSWSGKAELKTITSIEANSTLPRLQGNRLFSALYVNEVLTRLLQPNDQHSDLFPLYQWVLEALVGDGLIDVILRHFELRLLEDLGYGLDFSSDVASGESISAHQYYHFKPGSGFSLALPSANDKSHTRGYYSGELLLAIGSRQFDQPSRLAAKYLCRQALSPLLGNKPLKSRELFQ